MKSQDVFLVSLVAESVLEEKIIAELIGLGAKGYTTYEVRGYGSRGARSSDVDGKNIKIEVIASKKIADLIMSTCKEKYFDSYGMVGWLTKIDVLRESKFP